MSDVGMNVFRCDEAMPGRAVGSVTMGSVRKGDAVEVLHNGNVVKTGRITRISRFSAADLDEVHEPRVCVLRMSYWDGWQDGDEVRVLVSLTHRAYVARRVV